LDLKRSGSQRLRIAAAMGTAVGFWAVNALLMGPRLAGPGGARAFLENLGLAVTFVTSVPAAIVAFALVSERDVVLGRDALPGVGRRTVILPFVAGIGTMGAGALVTVLALLWWQGGAFTLTLQSYGPRLLAVGAGFALMGSFVGNLTGSVTLEARDLGHWVRANLILAVSLTSFWLFLMFAVLHIMRRGISGLTP
jgi:hypothetical protein